MPEQTKALLKIVYNMYGWYVAIRRNNGYLMANIRKLSKLVANKMCGYCFRTSGALGSNTIYFFSVSHTLSLSAFDFRAISHLSFYPTKSNWNLSSTLLYNVKPMSTDFST